MGLTKPRAAQIFNLDYKQSTRVVTTVSVSLSGGAPSSVDGVSLTLGDRVLVTGQSTGSQNGLYYVTTLGSGANGTWARTSDGNENGEIEAGMIVMVTEGVIYADTQWKLITDDPITIGTTALTFTQNYMANSISSGTSNVVVNSNANVTISSAGTANVLTVSSTGTVTSGTASITGNVTGGNISTEGELKTTGTFLLGTQEFYPQGSDGFSVNENFNAGNATVTAYHYTSGAGRSAVVFDTAVTGQFTTGFGATGNAATNKFVQFAEYGNTTWEWRKDVGISAPNLNGGTLLANIDPGGNLYTIGNISSAGNISATGNITANYFLGNVACASGIYASRIFNGTSEANIGASGGNANISIGGTSNVVVFATSGEYVTGLLSVTGNITGGNISATNHTGTTVSVTGTVTAASTVGGVITGSSSSVTGTQTAASTVGGVITGSSASISGNVTGGNINTAGNVSATGNVAGNYLLANIYFATGFSASRIFNGTSEANIGASGGNANISIGGTSNVVVFSTAGEYVTGLLSVTGNITGGNISATNHTGTNVSVTGTVTAASTVGGVITGSSASVTGTVTAASTVGGVITGSSASVTGNVTGANVVASTALTNGNITITGANIVSTGPTLTIDPNGSGGIDGNVIITGNLCVTGNVTYINSNNVTTNDLTINMANNAATAAAANGGGIGVGPAGSEYISLTYNSTSNIWVATNGLSSQGILSATGNVSGGNVLTGGLISATGNVTGGNVLTVGLVSATGNVTGNYLLGNGRQLTGINAFSNIAVANGNSIVANSISSTLTLTAGSGITLVATPGTGVITIATSSSGTSIFATGGDMGTVTETVTASEDLGSVTEAVTTSYDLGSVVSASGLVYPSQLILPAYTPATLPSAAPAAQFVYLSTSSVGAMTAFSDGTNWRFTSSGNIVS